MDNGRALSDMRAFALSVTYVRYSGVYDSLDTSEHCGTTEGIALVNTQQNVYNSNSAGLSDEHYVKLPNERGMIRDYMRDVLREGYFAHLKAHKAGVGNVDAKTQYLRSLDGMQIIPEDAAPKRCDTY